MRSYSGYLDHVIALECLFACENRAASPCERWDQMKSRIRPVRLGHHPHGSNVKILLAVAAMVCIQIAGAETSATMVPDSAAGTLQQRVAKSTVIVRGTVISAEGKDKVEYRDGRGIPKGIYTSVRFRIIDRIKGDLLDSVLIFEMPGGIVGDRETIVMDIPYFPHKAGDTAILLLDEHKEESALEPREVSLGLRPVFGGVIHFFGGMVYQNKSLIPGDTYTQYVKALASGQDISLDSFMQALPKPALIPPKIGTGGTTSPDQMRELDKSEPRDGAAGTRTTDSVGSTMTPTVGSGDSVPSETIPEWLMKADKPKKADTAWVDPAKVNTGQFSPPRPAGPVRQLSPKEIPTTWLDKAKEPVKVDTGTVDTGQIDPPRPYDSVGEPRRELQNLSKKGPDTFPIPASPQVLTATIWEADWTDELDDDGDGYVHYTALIWDSDIIGGSGSLQVYEIIYDKLSTSGTWNYFTTTQVHTITDNESELQYQGIDCGSHGLWDWKIEVYRSDLGSPDYTRNPSNDPDLNDKPMETAAEEQITATIYQASWTNEVDSDGDGYVRSADLNWDPDVAFVGSSLDVFERISYKSSSGSTWTVFTTTPVHTIIGQSTGDIQFQTISGLSHNLWDWRIEVFRSGQMGPDDIRDPSNDVDLDDKPMEVAGEDQLTATIWGAWWMNEIDNDGDGYTQYAWLGWQPEVVGGSGSLSVYEKIYYKLSTTGTWTFATTTPTHTITDQSGLNEQHLPVAAGTHGLYDWKIEIYRSGQGGADYTRDPANEPALDNKPMELASEDAVRPVITSITPDHQSAGTGSDVTIYGNYFGTLSGPAGVWFTHNPYSEGDEPPILPATVISWENDEIHCVVPVADRRYSASSGPVEVRSSSGDLSDGAEYAVSFGWEQSAWPAVSVPFYVNANTADCAGEELAAKSAANTWNSVCANLVLYYAGDTDIIGSISPDGVNEIVWVPSLPGNAFASTVIHRHPVLGSIIEECDILFDESEMWSTSGTTPPGQIDVGSIALHEMGHWVGLTDLYGTIDSQNDYAKVMFGWYAPGTAKRALHADDIAGINWIYYPTGADCPCAADPRCDGVRSDVLDVTDCINCAFRGQVPPPGQDADCPYGRLDVNASGEVDILDVTAVINVAFRGNSAGAEYCLHPCNGCPDLNLGGGPLVVIRNDGGHNEGMGRGRRENGMRVGGVRVAH